MEKCCTPRGNCQCTEQQVIEAVEKEDKKPRIDDDDGVAATTLQCGLLLLTFIHFIL